MSVNFQREFSLVGGGVQFALVAALGRENQKVRFYIWPWPLCVVNMRWNMRSSSPPESHLELPAKASALGCFRCLVGGWGQVGNQCLSASVTLRRPSGCVLYTRILLGAWDQDSPRAHHTCTWGCCWLCICSQLPLVMLALQAATCVTSTEGSTGEDVTAFRRPRFKSQLCHCLLSEPERDHLAALWLTFSFCGGSVINN